MRSFAGRPLRSLCYIVSINFLGLCLFTGAVSATPLSYTVTATIQPTATIIVDSSSKITEILSNTNKPEVLNVYSGSLRGKHLLMSTLVYDQFQKITDHGKLCRQGIVYQASGVSNNPKTYQRLPWLNTLAGWVLKYQLNKFY